jgi:hypothetical protein
MNKPFNPLLSMLGTATPFTTPAPSGAPETERTEAVEQAPSAPLPESRAPQRPRPRISLARLLNSPTNGLGW